MTKPPYRLSLGSLYRYDAAMGAYVHCMRTTAKHLRTAVAQYERALEIQQYSRQIV
jgi:hypothetical protein